MTIASKITTLDGIKQDIKAAIEAKGVTVGSAPFGDYDTKISEITGGGGGPVIPPPHTMSISWTRPADWLAMPTVTNTENKVVILAAVFEGMANKVALQIDTINYVVDWGDGTSDTKTGSTTAEHTYDFANPLFDGTTTSYGFKQTLITITPVTAGQNFPVIRFQQKYTGAPAGTIATPFLDILVSAPQCGYMSLGGAGTVTHAYLQKFTVLSSNLNDMANFANNTSGGIACPTLAYVDMLGNITTNSRNATFQNCYALEYVRVNCSNAVTLTSTFQNCVSLRTADLTSTPAGANMTNMFNSCRSLLDTADIVGLNITGACNLNTTFGNCYALLEVTCNNVNPTNLNNTFNNCSALTKITGIVPTSAMTSINTAFSGCSNLVIINDGVLDCSYVTGTGMQSAFNNCASLLALDIVGVGAITTLNSTFISCSALFEIKNLVVPSTVTNMASTFLGCTSLRSLPVMNTDNVTTIASAFKNCFSLKDISMTSTAKVTDMDGAFGYCRNLQTLTITNFDTSKVTKFANGLFGNPLLADTAAFSGALTLNLLGLAVGGEMCLGDACGFESLTLINTNNLANVSQYATMISNNRRLKYLNIANLANLTQNPTNKLVPGCTQLQRCILTGLTRTTSVASCAMSASAINEMFTSMGTALSGATITVTGNPGASTCTPSIATAKGWTVVQ